MLSALLPAFGTWREIPSRARACSAAATVTLHLALVVAATGTLISETPRDLPPVGVQLIGSLVTSSVAPLDTALPNSPVPIEQESLNAIELTPMPPPDVASIAADSFDTGREADWGDTAELERLQGLYLGQIKGRIDRVLETLSTSEAVQTSCKAVVVQDTVGRVLDIDLDRCARSDESKALLVTAIRRASPLPRPPRGLAMGSYLTLELAELRL